uniref:Uncharacterized protein n=1 Tax=Ciona savignyi TaxID=51511 RepID=H2ZR31_CIOSA
MVFESLVVDLLNKYLGKYIENLDASQLKLGIWGGDAVLENLLIKSDVLKELDVPFQISYGFLGKLTLKIPWKNLYKDSVEATVDGLYLLVVPDTSDTYDAAKQAKWEQDAKQAMLKAIEDKEIQSLQVKKDEVQQDGFVEKLASQIIRNVQIHIHNIHIRYEDQTTDENWVPTTLDESISNIFKLVDLQYFSMYWNSSPNDYFKDFPPSQQLFLLKNTIASKTVLPQDFSYSKLIFYDLLFSYKLLIVYNTFTAVSFNCLNSSFTVIRPIKMQAQLEINPKSHVDLKPKISVTLEVNELGFQLLHSQYHGVLLLLDDIDRMAINSHFRKYRPAVRVVGNSSKWWKYALQCINDSVIVHTRQWNWEYIKKHRDNVRHYKAKYKLKLESKYPDQTLLDQLIEIENTLDVFNITLAKKMSEIELSRDGIQIRNADYVQLHSTSSSTGWFGGWFSKRTPESKKPKENKGLDAVMTTEEKKKLYLSIGYSEGELVDDSKLPKSYVTINSLVDFVTPPQQIKLQGLRNVAASTYNDVKEQTTTSLKSIIQTKTITQIEIQFSSSYFILPMDGYFLRIYDVFHIDVQNIQLLLQSSSEDDFFTADSDSSDEEEYFESKKVKSRTKLKELPGVQQMTNLQLNFTINQITLSICEEYSSTSMDEVLNLHVNALSSNVKVRTWDTSIELSLQSLIVNHSQFTTSENGVLPFLHTQADPQSEYVIYFFLNMCNVMDNIFMLFLFLIIRLGLLHVTVHVQAILKLQSFITSLTQLLSESITDEVNVQPVVEADVSDSKSNYAKLNLVDSKTSLDEISNVVNLSMMLKVECLDVTVIDQHETLSTLKVEGVQSCVMLTAPWNQFSMKIHNLVVRDVGTDLLYPHIVSAVGNEVVKMDFTSYNATIDETTGSGGITVDANLKMELGCLRVVFLSKFVDKLVGYGKKFSETKEIAKAVGSAAQEKAVATAQELMMTHPCIKMDICLSAPTIIVPVHSKSIEVLVLDLGVLQAENVFTEVGKVGNKIAIMDQMKISLTDVQVLRRSFNIDMTSYSEHNLLQPVDLKVKVDRNLSSTWFHNAPDMSIDSVLHQLSVSLSQGDLRFIMQVLELNIWEEHEHMAEEHLIPKRDEGISNFKYFDIIGEEESSSVQPSAEPPWDLFKVIFRMESLELKLFADEKRVDFLSELKFVNVLGNVLQKSDQSSSMEVSLDDLLLEDSRSKQVGCVNQLIKRKLTSDSGTALVNMEYRQGVGTVDVELTFSNLSAIISIEFYLELYNFALEGLIGKEKSQTDIVGSEKKAQSVRKSEPPVSTSMKVQVKVDQPEILVMTDFRSIQSEAIILALNCLMNYEQSADGKAQMIHAELSNMNIIGCVYNSYINQHKSKFQQFKKILSPCNVSATGFITDALQLEVTKIRLEVSPIILATLNDMAAQFKPVEKEELSQSRFINLQTEIFLYSATDLPSSPRTNIIREVANINVDMIQVQLEAGSGHNTHSIALITIYSTLEDWSSGEMSGECRLTMGAAYFNDAMSVWEPLLEPVEVNPGTLDATYQPWELTMRLQQKALDSKNLEVDDTPLLSVHVQAKNVLQTTISNVGLNVHSSLSGEFGRKVSMDSQVQDTAAFKIFNFLGHPIYIKLTDGLCVIGDVTQFEHGVKHREQLLLNYSSTQDQDLWSLLSSQKRKHNKDDANIFIKSEEGEAIPINIWNTDVEMYSLSSTAGKPFLINVDSVAGMKYIEIHSCVVLYNHMSIKVEVYSNDSHFIGEIHPDMKLPLPTFCVKDESVKVKPVHDRSFTSSSRNCHLGDEDLPHLACLKGGEAGDGMLSSLVSLGDSVASVSLQISSTNSTSLAVEVHLWPLLVLCNFLSVPIHFSVVGIAYESNLNKLENGRSIQVLDVEMGKSKLKVKIPSYQDKSWNCVVDLQEGMNELTDCMFTDSSNKSSTLLLAKHITYSDGVMKVTLFSPYWLVNNTGLTLEYKPADNNHTIQSNNESIVMFAFSSRTFLSTKKLQLRACNSEFSENFGIDAVGSSGFVSCKTKQFTYIVATEIILTSFSLSKMVVFKPYYSFLNKSKQDVEFKEFEAIDWLLVPSGKVVHFWPEYSNSLVVRMKGSMAQSDKIGFKKMDSGFLFQIGKKVMFVDISVTESSNNISVRDYFDGSSALLVVNDTLNNNLQFNHGSKEVFIPPGFAQHILWSTTSPKREFQWIYSTEKQQLNMGIEKYGSFNSDGTMIYFVIFSAGLQKTFLLTNNQQRAWFAESGLKLERPQLQLNLSLHGVICSFVDSFLHREVATLSIISSGLQWEEKPRKRWKPLAVKYSKFLEDLHQKKLQGEATVQVLFVFPPDIVSMDKYQFDLRQMQVVKPWKCDLQRSFAPGVWLCVNITRYQKSLHLKVNNIQMDSQLFGAIFPVILNPIPLPSSVAIDNIPKPFIELSMMQEISENQTFLHVKYFKVLVQELSIKLDMGLLSALSAVFGGNDYKVTEKQAYQNFVGDLKSLENMKISSCAEAESVINYFDLLHLSPLKVHVSFSMQNNIDDTDSSDSSIVKLPFSALYILLQSIGVTLSDIDDVVFKLAFFERRFQFFTGTELQDSVLNHYQGQAIKQIYVLVFGLDVLGNPYGLVMGLAEGVTSLFYEPYQGMIQGPEEFFEGLGLGTLSLLGHTLGGAAGAVSKVTGAIGKGIATITMDDEFQKKRLEAKSKHPADIKKNLARGGKGAVMGLFSGVTGVVTKPLEGAKKDGATGFFKGIGKGLIGVVARPVSGVVDLASTTFDTIQRQVILIADRSEEVQKLRPPRWINPDSGIITLYSLRNATGFAILNEIEKGKFAMDGHYVDHVATKEDNKGVLLITNKFVIEAHTGEVFGQWKCDWFCSYQEFLTQPQLNQTYIKFFLKVKCISTMICVFHIVTFTTESNFRQSPNDSWEINPISIP